MIEHYIKILKQIAVYTVLDCWYTGYRVHLQLNHIWNLNNVAKSPGLEYFFKYVEYGLSLV